MSILLIAIRYLRLLIKRMTESMLHLLVLCHGGKARGAVPIFGLQELHFHASTFTSIRLGCRGPSFDSIVWDAALNRLVLRRISSGLRNIVSTLVYAIWRLGRKLDVLDAQVFCFYWLNFIIQGSVS